MGGLSALLDDIVAFAKLAAGSAGKMGAVAAKSSGKAAGVVIDDTAVTPSYVHGLAAERELPIIWRITKGSLRNKYQYVLPMVLVLTQIGSGAVSAVLMLGGAYLVFEGCAKVYGGHGEHPVELGEDDIVKRATRTDLVLSAEIMIISANEVVDEPLVHQAGTLILVALAMTFVVYGAVALIVKIDDVGLFMVERGERTAQGMGRALVKSMLGVLRVMSVIGTAAMLWVGGHIIVEHSSVFGLEGPHHLIEDLSGSLAVSGGLEGVVNWAVKTGLHLLVGFVLGTLAWWVKKTLGALRAKLPDAQS